MTTPQHSFKDKAAARSLARAKMQGVTPEMSQDWGMRMLENLMALPVWANARTIMCFTSLPGEPNTELMLRQILHERRVLCLPRQTDQPGIMQAHKVAALFGLTRGPHGILEPPAGMQVIQPEEIDLIIAPCLAASPSGTRLGHGGGYYDRFFAKTNATRAVLCPTQQIFSQLPADENDLPAHIIVTENGIL